MNPSSYRAEVFICQKICSPPTEIPYKPSRHAHLYEYIEILTTRAAVGQLDQSGPNIMPIPSLFGYHLKRNELLLNIRVEKFLKLS